MALSLAITQQKAIRNTLVYIGHYHPANLTSLLLLRVRIILAIKVATVTSD